MSQCNVRGLHPAEATWSFVYTNPHFSSEVRYHSEEIPNVPWGFKSILQSLKWALHLGICRFFELIKYYDPLQQNCTPCLDKQNSFWGIIFTIKLIDCNTKWSLLDFYCPTEMFLKILLFYDSNMGIYIRIFII